MPHANEAELIEATENFDEYMEVVWEMYARLRAEGVDVATLTKQYKTVPLSFVLMEQFNQLLDAITDHPLRKILPEPEEPAADA